MFRALISKAFAEQSLVRWITTEKDKTAKVKEKQLQGHVCIEYVDDDGVDAGALCGDFFKKCCRC